jgi:hypothetical protein
VCGPPHRPEDRRLTRAASHSLRAPALCRSRALPATWAHPVPPAVPRGRPPARCQDSSRVTRWGNNSPIVLYLTSRQTVPNAMLPGGTTKIIRRTRARRLESWLFGTRCIMTGAAP